MLESMPDSTNSHSSMNFNESMHKYLPIKCSALFLGYSFTQQMIHSQPKQIDRFFLPTYLCLVPWNQMHPKNARVFFPSSSEATVARYFRPFAWVYLTNSTITKFQRRKWKKNLHAAISGETSKKWHCTPAWKQSNKVRRGNLMGNFIILKHEA